MGDAANLSPLWRKVGINGYALDDLRDPSCSGRNALRNEAMMEMLFSSGLRITEAAALLTVELPTHDRHAVGLNDADLPAAIAKGRHPRTWYLFNDALSLVNGYVMWLELGSGFVWRYAAAFV